VHYTERQPGTCGAIADQVLAASTATPTDTACTGPSTTSDDGCHESADLTCTLPTFGAGYTQHSTMTCDWAADANSAACVLSMKILRPDGRNYCVSTYDMAVARR
jgi:hypothetical protein